MDPEGNQQFIYGNPVLNASYNSSARQPGGAQHELAPSHPQNQDYDDAGMTAMSFSNRPPDEGNLLQYHSGSAFGTMTSFDRLSQYDLMEDYNDMDLAVFEDQDWSGSRFMTEGMQQLQAQSRLPPTQQMSGTAAFEPWTGLAPVNNQPSHVEETQTMRSLQGHTHDANVPDSYGSVSDAGAASTSDLSFECHFCFNKYSTRALLEIHWKTKHGTDRPAPVPDTPRCRFERCEETLQDMESLIWHEKNHLFKLPYPAKPLCNVVAGVNPLICRVTKCSFTSFDIDKFGDHIFRTGNHSPATLHSEYLAFEDEIKQLGVLGLHRMKFKEPSLRCRFSKCSRYFRSSSARLEHEKSHICEYPGCTDAILRAQSKTHEQALRVHWEEAHASHVLYLCPDRINCSKAFQRAIQRDKHCREDHASCFRWCPIPNCAGSFLAAHDQAEHLYHAHLIEDIEHYYPQHKLQFYRPELKARDEQAGARVNELYFDTVLVQPYQDDTIIERIWTQDQRGWRVFSRSQQLEKIVKSKNVRKEDLSTLQHN